MVSVVARERFLMVSVVARERFLMVSGVAGNVFLWFPSLFFLFMVSVVGFCYGFRLLQDRGCLSDGNRKKTTRTFPRRTKYIFICIGSAPASSRAPQSPASGSAGPSTPAGAQWILLKHISLSLSLYLYIYIYIYLFIYLCILYVYIYIYTYVLINATVLRGDPLV